MFSWREGWDRSFGWYEYIRGYTDKSTHCSRSRAAPYSHD